MKVLHLNYHDIEGGAAIAMNRLHELLKKNNINSKILVFSKKKNSEDIILAPNQIKKFTNLIKNKISFNLTKFQKIYNKSTHSLNIFNSGIQSSIEKLKPDILHMHWINNEFISIKEIGKINIPIVWTFYDMWPFCGAEHYTFEKRYINGYENFNKPIENNGVDLNKIIWEQKKKFWKNNKFQIVGISNWLSSEISKSKLFKNNKIYTIPPPIDFSKWQDINKINARKTLGLNHNKKYFLFGAANGIKDKRKGFDIIADIYKTNFKNNKEIEFIFFGDNDKKILNNLDMPVNSFGHINYDNYEKLSLLYSAANLTLLPSKLEAFGQIGLESLACKTPVISFKGTGPEHMIEHKKNGYLANYLNKNDFLNGINWYLNLSSNQIEILNNNSREIVKKKFQEKIIFEKYLEIYNKLI